MYCNSSKSRMCRRVWMLDSHFPFHRPLCLTKYLLFVIVCITSQPAMSTKEDVTCEIPIVELMAPAFLTCTFPEDIRQSKTYFSVVHMNSSGKPVVDCLWVKGELDCVSAPGYKVSLTVTKELTVWIPQVLSNMVGTYYCRESASTDRGIQYCELVLKSDAPNFPYVGVIVGVVVSVLTVATVAGVLIWKMKCRKRNEIPDSKRRNPESSEESEALVLKGANNIITESGIVTTPSTSQDTLESNIVTTASTAQETNTRLQELSDEFRKICPDFEKSSYLVPPFYYNRITRTLTNLAGQEVYVTDLPSESVKYDMVLQVVLQRLSRLSEYEKGMFVISQFDYDDYSAIPGKDPASPTPPLPAALRTQDKTFGQFDILIVHKKHGLIVGVVCQVCQDTEETTEDKVVTELKKCFKQLDNAAHMLKHLMSDKRESFNIGKILFLPNLPEKSFKATSDKHTDLAKVPTLSTYLHSPDTAGLHEVCLCREHLADDDGIGKLKGWLNQRPSGSKDDTFITAEQFVTVLTRFCRPAAKKSWSSMHFLGILKKSCTPLSLGHTVNAIGDMFSIPTLQSEQVDVLTENYPRVFLTGPPASGKTRTLVVKGRQWLSEGHTVHVVSTWKGSRAASLILYNALRTASDKHMGSKGSDRVSLTMLEERDVKKMIETMSSLASGEPLYIIADEAGPYQKTQPAFRSFVDGFKNKFDNLHVWAASCSPYIVPNCCSTKRFENTFTCPPAILLNPRLKQIAKDCEIDTQKPVSKITAPTEGLPVKVLKHAGQSHIERYPCDCQTCAEEVVEFLGTLKICGKETCSQTTESSEHLLLGDVLVLFETSFDEKTALYRVLQKKSLDFQIFDEKDRDRADAALNGNSNKVLVAKAKHLFGIKRKVVVYVEGDPKDSRKVPVSWKRLRGLTSATSQLIWVKGSP